MKTKDVNEIVGNVCIYYVNIEDSRKSHLPYGDVFLKMYLKISQHILTTYLNFSSVHKNQTRDNVHP